MALIGIYHKIFDCQDLFCIVSFPLTPAPTAAYFCLQDVAKEAWSLPVQGPFQRTNTHRYIEESKALCTANHCSSMGVILFSYSDFIFIWMVAVWPWLWQSWKVQTQVVMYTNLFSWSTNFSLLKALKRKTSFHHWIIYDLWWMYISAFGNTLISVKLWLRYFGA